jgi:hypothetical protein
MISRTVIAGAKTALETMVCESSGDFVILAAVQMFPQALVQIWIKNALRLDENA